MLTPLLLALLLHVPHTEREERWSRQDARDSRDRRIHGPLVPVAYLPPVEVSYSLDEGTGETAGDSSGHNNTLTFGGFNYGWTLGHFHNAISDTGSGYMEAANTGGVAPAGRSYDISGIGLTISFWANITSDATPADYELLCTPWAPTTFVNPYFQYAVEFDNNGDKSLDLQLGFGANTGATFSIAAESVPVATWTHFAFTYDGAFVRGYVNGVQVLAEAETRAIVARGNSLRLGTDAVYGQRYKGALDNVRIYARALTSTQVLTDMTTPIN